RRVGVHGDHFGSGENLETVTTVEILGPTDEHHRNVELGRGPLGPFDDLARCLVASHRVDRDRQHQDGLPTPHRWRGGRGTNRSSRTRGGEAWPHRIGGRRCEEARRPSTRWRGGCGSSTWTSSSWGRPC